jgi:hypothetical protein
MQQLNVISVMSVPMLLVEKEKEVLIAFTVPRGKSVVFFEGSDVSKYIVEAQLTLN